MGDRAEFTEPGWHTGKIERTVFGKSKKGTPKIGVKLRVMTGSQKGKETWWDLYLSDKAKPYSIEKLQKIVPDFTGDLGERLENPDMFVGVLLRFFVEQNEGGYWNINNVAFNNTERIDVMDRDEWEEILAGKPTPKEALAESKPEVKVDDLPF